MFDVVPFGQHVAVGFELLGFGEPPCGEPYERVPPQRGLHAFHRHALGGVAVGDVARLMGYDGLQLSGRDLVPEVDRAEERERRNPLRGAHERETLRAGDRRTAPQPADAHDLPQHDARDQPDPDQVYRQAYRFGRDGRSRLFDHLGGPFGRGQCDRRGDLDHLARPDGDAQQRNDRRQEGRCEQVGPAPAEPHVPFEQDGVGRQQHAAASQHFEGVDGEGFHGGYFLALRMISRISSISRAEMFSWREKNDTSWASEPSK